MFQNTGSSCVHTMGNYFGVGSPGAGPKPVAGVVSDANTLRITFSQCVSISSNAGIEYRIDAGAWTQVASRTSVSDTVWNFGTVAISPGDDVRWRYTGGGSIVDCENAENIGEQEIPVQNPLELQGDYILLETGGTDIVLVEEDIADTDGVQTEEAQ
jgi:hypothetical protein